MYQSRDRVVNGTWKKNPQPQESGGRGHSERVIVGPPARIGANCYNRHMLYWECKRRLNELLKFRELVVTYFSHRTIPHFQTVHEDDTARKARSEINLRMNAAIRSCLRIGQTLTVFYSPPPVRGGFAGNLNLIQNMFELHTFQIPPSRVIDSLNRAIGDYERLQRELFRSLWNPLYWLRLGVANLLSLPFRILGAAGFNSQAIEHSTAGKVSKAIAAFAGFIVTVLTILHSLGVSTGWRDITALFRHRP